MDLKVAIVVPSMGTWKSATAWCVAKAMQCFMECDYKGEKQVELFAVTGSNLLEVRTKGVAEAWKWGATHILWVDSDMYFPHDSIQALIRHNKLVVAANYVRKVIPPVPVAYVENDDEIGALYTRKDSTGLVEVKHVGMGLMLTNMDVFDAADMPYFHFEPIPPHNVGWLSEDYYFCRNLRSVGIKIHVDQDLSQFVAHIGDLHFTPGMAETGEDILKKSYEDLHQEGRKAALERHK